MGTIRDLAYAGNAGAFRLYETNDVPASGPHDPDKVSEIPALFGAIEDAITPTTSGYMGLGVAADPTVHLSVQTASNERGIAIMHYASETGQYGLDIHCYKNAGATDANSAIAIHNYSADFPAMIIDSTDQQALLALNNSENAVTSPGTRGSGPFISLSGYAGDELTTRRNLGFLNGFMQFAHNFDDVMWTFATGLIVNGPSTLTNRALAVTALNSGYATTISGTDSGLFASTSADGGNTLVAQKSGTGAGTVAWLINGGVGDAILVTDLSSNTKFKVDSLGSIFGAADLAWHPSASAAPANNGDLAVSVPNNTSLVFKYKGSDSTVRTATLTLS